MLGAGEANVRLPEPAPGLRRWPRDVPLPRYVPRAQAERRPALSAPDLRNDFNELRALLLDTAVEAQGLAAGLDLALAVVRHLCAENRRPAVSDEVAERRVLGGLLRGPANEPGRVALEDVRELEPRDFAGEGHAMLFALALSGLELETERRPSVLYPGPSRRLCCVPVVRRALELDMSLPGVQAALDALDELPWPATCPRVEIATVAGLGRWRRAGR